MSESHKDLVIDYLYDELAPDGRDAFEASMRADATLAAEVASLGETRRLVKVAAGAPPVAPAALLAKLQREARLAVAQPPEPSFWQKAAALLFQPAAGLAFVVAAVIGVGAWVKFGPTRAPAGQPPLPNVAVATEAAPEGGLRSMHETTVEASDKSDRAALDGTEVAAVPIPSPSPMGAAEAPVRAGGEVASGRGEPEGGKDAAPGALAFAGSNSLVRTKEAGALANQWQDAAAQRAEVPQGAPTTLDEEEPAPEDALERQVVAALAEQQRAVAAEKAIPVQLGIRRGEENDATAEPRGPNFYGGGLGSGAPQSASGPSALGGNVGSNAPLGVQEQWLRNGDEALARPDVAAAAPAPPAAPAAAAVDGAPPAVVTGEVAPPRTEAARESRPGDVFEPREPAPKSTSGERAAPAADAPSRVDTAEAHYRAQRYEQAIRELETYLQDPAAGQGSDSAEANDARRRLAESYERANRLEQAAAAYKTLLDRAPAYRFRAAVLVEWAQVEFELGRLESARGLLRQALADPAAEDAGLRDASKVRLAEVERLLSAREAGQAAKPSVGSGGSGSNGPVAAPKKRSASKPMAPRKNEQDLVIPAEPAAPAK